MIPEKYIKEAERLGKGVYVVEGHMKGEVMKIKHYPLIAKNQVEARMRAKKVISKNLVVEKISKVW